MERLLFLTCLLLCPCHIKFVSALNSTNYGKRFLVSVPFVVIDSQKNVFSEITFTMHSLHNVNFEVLITAGAACKKETVQIGRKHDSTITMQDCTGNVKDSKEVVRTPFILTGPRLFSVCVTANHFSYSSETMMVVPVEGWGMSYYAITLRYKPTIQIITDLANHLTIDQFVHENGGLVPLASISKELPAQSSYDLVSCIHDEQVDREFTGTHIKGMTPIGVVSGNCQSGASNEKCVAEGKSMDDSIAKTMVIESLLPMESFGKEFIAYNTFSQPNSTYVVVLVTKNWTMVNVSIGESRITVVPLEKNAFEIHNVKNGVQITSNNSVQVMVVRKSSCILDGDNYNGQAALSLVLPTALFLSTYNWRTPKTPEAIIADYVILIATSDGRKNMILDGAKVLKGSKMEWTQVEGSTDWFIVEVLLDNKSLVTHFATSLERRTPFGCYLYGIHSDSYMHPAGFISSDLRKQVNCSNAQFVKTPSDFVDNDCDGLVDEEAINGIDDDNDNLIDEDTVLNSVDGHWGEWTKWMCLTCASTLRMRKRFCNNPEPTGNGIECLGEEIESGSGPCESNCTGRSKSKPSTRVGRHRRMESSTGPSRVITTEGTKNVNSTAGTTLVAVKTAAWEVNAYWDAWTEWKCLEPCDSDKMFRFRKCYDKKILKVSDACEGPRVDDRPANCKKRCAQACPAFKWRTDCKGDCSNCEEDCNKLNGSCVRCKPGYQNPHMSCSDMCDPFHYGYMCQEQCTVKCNGDDCVDRVTGKCPEQANTAWLAFFLLVIPPIFILLYLRYKHIQSGREDPLAFIMESPSHLGITASKPSLTASRSRGSVRSATSMGARQSRGSVRSSHRGSDGLQQVRSSSAVN